LSSAWRSVTSWRYGDWGTSGGLRPARSIGVGQDSVEILTEAGVPAERVAELLRAMA